MLDMTKVLRCVRLSEWAYGNIQQMKDNLAAHEYSTEKLKFFNKDGAQAYGMYTKTGEVVVVFRGTEPDTFNDIIADLKAWPSASETKGKVHDGFKDELNKIYPLILEWLGSTRDKTVIITGHSLGAAMASLFAARLHQMDIDVELYTFGSPRVGNREWAQQFKDIKAYRFINNNDLVCRVPTSLYYHHVGETYYFSYKGNLMRNANAWQRFTDRIRSRIRVITKLEVFDSLYDHGIPKYNNRVKENK